MNPVVVLLVIVKNSPLFIFCPMILIPSIDPKALVNVMTLPVDVVPLDMLPCDSVRLASERFTCSADTTGCHQYQCHLSLNLKPLAE